MLTYTIQMCNHCDNPKWLPTCAHNAIYKRKDGFAIIHPEKCVGCGACAAACPYDAIYQNKEPNIFQNIQAVRICLIMVISFLVMLRIVKQKQLNLQMDIKNIINLVYAQKNL